MSRKILIANDGSPGAFKALVTAIAWAKQHDAALHMVAVEEFSAAPVTIEDVVEEKHEQNHRFGHVLARARAVAKQEEIVLYRHLLVGHPVRTIIDLIEREGFDLLVIGFMGHSALYQRIIGSTSERLVRLAPCSVLVVK